MNLFIKPDFYAVCYDEHCTAILSLHFFIALIQFSVCFKNLLFDILNYYDLIVAAILFAGLQLIAVTKIIGIYQRGESNTFSILILLQVEHLAKNI